ncbi:MAG: hypothetical protein EU517_01205 [Promethearchaeota archaeon]|nr:MAG: hypothetical protein EU517_01205 [Candidatus Lokiarchaeota archaeon]
MQKSNSNDVNEKVSQKLNALNKKTRNYIKDVVVLVNREIGVNKIVSILLFGSQQPKNKTENTSVSDCDLLFIFKDRVSSRHIREIEKYFIALEIKHNFESANKNLIRKLISSIEHATGMFISHFLTKERYWNNAIFHKIFQVNKVFSALFAPRHIVLSNVLINSTILYGTDLRNIIRKNIKVSVFEMFKSLIMNLFISFFSLLLSPVKKLKSIKFQLEAIKWSLRSSNYYCFRDTQNLEDIIERFVSLEKFSSQQKAQSYYDSFLELRREPYHKLRFMLRSPIRILKIHIKAIKYRKIIKKGGIQIPSEPQRQIDPSQSFPIQF